MNAPTSLPQSGNLKKYTSKNPFVRYLVRNFLSSLDTVIKSRNITDILDVGCGEAMVIKYLQEQNPSIKFKGVDIDQESLDFARNMNPRSGFETASIYGLQAYQGRHEAVLALEVLEHLEHPRKALEQVKALQSRWCIFSVPHEPYFRVSNMLAGRYLTRWGNTPGHIQNWTKGKFLSMVGDYFKVIDVRTPFPWIMVVCGQK